MVKPKPTKRMSGTTLIKLKLGDPTASMSPTHVHKACNAKNATRIIPADVLNPLESRDVLWGWLSEFSVIFTHIQSSMLRAPNGLRYPLVGGTRQRRFAGTNSKPRKLPENAASPTSRVHAVLGGFFMSAYCRE